MVRIIQCPQCHYPVRRRRLQKHQEHMCIKRKIKCQWCDNETNADIYPIKHNDFCKSSPKTCKFCNIDVKYGELPDHLSECHVLDKLLLDKYGIDSSKIDKISFKLILSEMSFIGALRKYRLLDTNIPKRWSLPDQMAHAIDETMNIRLFYCAIMFNCDILDNHYWGHYMAGRAIVKTRKTKYNETHGHDIYPQKLYRLCPPILLPDFQYMFEKELTKIVLLRYCDTHELKYYYEKHDGIEKIMINNIEFYFIYHSEKFQQYLDQIAEYFKTTVLNIYVSKMIIDYAYQNTPINRAIDIIYLEQYYMEQTADLRIVLDGKE